MAVARSAGNIAEIAARSASILVTMKAITEILYLRNGFRVRIEGVLTSENDSELWLIDRYCQSHRIIKSEIYSRREFHD